MDGPVSTPAPAGRSSLRPSELRPWKGCREFQRRAGGRSSSQPSHGLVPAPCVPCHQGFLSFLPSSTLAIFLFRDTPFSGKPSLALRPPHYPGGATWVPLPPEGRGPPFLLAAAAPLLCLQHQDQPRCPPHCGPPAAVGVDFEPPLLGSHPTSAACLLCASR